MDLAFKIAWRNIWKHQGKSLVIGIILFFGAWLMTVGNGMISGMEKGMSENIVNLFTGDIVVISDEQEKDDVLYNATGKPLKVIKNVAAAKKVLDEAELIEEYLPATAGMVFVLNSSIDMGWILLLGVDIQRYLQIFPESFTVKEGHLFKPGEQGVLIPEKAREEMYNSMDFWVQPEGTHVNPEGLPVEVRKDAGSLEIRNDLVFMGLSESNSSIDIRVPVKGIIDYKALSGFWGNYGIVDIDSFREAHQYVTGAEAQVEIAKEKRDLLESNALDNLFGSEMVVKSAVLSQHEITVAEIQAQTQKSIPKYNPDGGSYNLAFIKLKKGVSQKEALWQLNDTFKQNQLNIRAVSWKDALGAFGNMAMVIKGALNLFIMFIFFVAIIVIVNTLSMTALERSSEIAMMRAIGAKKGFLRKMFIYETGILSFFFGGIGVVTGIISIFLINGADISTSHVLLQMVYGGNHLNPVFTFGDLMLGMIELGIVTLLSVLYPLTIVGKIVPLDAIARE